MSSQIYRVFLTPGGKFRGNTAISTELTPVRNSAATLLFRAVCSIEGHCCIPRKEGKQRNYQKISGRTVGKKRGTTEGRRMVGWKMRTVKKIVGQGNINEVIHLLN
jgi:hypothetical protein